MSSSDVGEQPLWCTQMAKADDFGYWQLVSQGMDLEDRRLRMFVRHNGSLGTGRETIVRKLLVEQTPEPYRVNTGFVVHPRNPSISSAQCDVLVYDPRVAQPLYRIDDFVVVQQSSARFVIEVRSNMSVTQKKSKNPRYPKEPKKTGLDQVFAVHASMIKFSRSVFGFGFDGPRFGTFLNGVVKRMKGNPEDVPECIVVHNRNYIMMRVDDPQKPAGPDKAFFLGVDFGARGESAEGSATALFMRLCHERLTSLMPHNADIIAIRAKEMNVPNSELKVIRPSGAIEDGYDYDRKNQ